MKPAPHDSLSTTGMSRAEFLRLAITAAIGVGVGVPGRAQRPAPASTMQTRPIPSTGEALPVVGLGTWQTFDAGTEKAERAPLREVLQRLFDAGGSVIDSSPMYGRSEQVAGDLLAELKAHDRAFVATKVWTRGRDDGIRQMRRSMQLLRDQRIELMQVHNLVDWRTHLRTLRAWKEEGMVRYIGVTHYTESGFGDLQDVMRSERIDFVQFNYALNDRGAEKRLLPLAADRGIAVLVNQPFGGGALLRALVDQPLPDWAADIECTSWAQVLLKFVLGHPAVTCVIPGTSRPAHVTDNCKAGTGVQADEAMRKQIAAWWERRR